MTAKKFSLPLLVSAILVISGCAPADIAPALDGPGGGQQTPEFAGPYADEYQQTWEQSDSAFVRQAIEDEQITAQEWAEVVQRLDDCLAAEGIEFKGFDEDGSYTADASAVGDRAEELMSECENESGSALVGYLRQMSIINPENRDFGELMVECLIREEAVPADYTAEKYKADVATLSFPYLDPEGGPAIYNRCNIDPLSLLSAR